MILGPNPDRVADIGSGECEAVSQLIRQNVNEREDAQTLCLFLYIFNYFLKKKTLIFYLNKIPLNF